jgi:hypothetical protein
MWGSDSLGCFYSDEEHSDMRQNAAEFEFYLFRKRPDLNDPRIEHP